MVSDKTLKVLDFDTAASLTGKGTAETYRDARKMYDGDHWLGGSGWVGPSLNTTNPLYQESMAYIQQLFTAQNAIKEIVDREVTATQPLTPSISFVLKRNVSEDDPVTQEERDELELITSTFLKWYKEKKIGKQVESAAANAALAGRSGIRFVFPASMLQSDGTIPSADINTFWRYIFAHEMNPNSYTIVQDPYSLENIGIYSYKVADIDGKNEQEYIERTYIAEDGTTVIETATKDKPWTGNDASVELGGNIVHHEMKRDPLITQTIIQLQKSMNLAITLMARNALLAGFLERIFLNAQPPMETIVDDKGIEREVPTKLRLGANSVSFITGIPVENDETGELSYTEPKAFYHEPTDVNNFIALKNELYSSILQEVHQSHALLTTQVKIPGESRRQARSEFRTAAEITATQVAETLSWLGSMFLGYSDLIANTSYMEKYKPSVNAVVEIGDLPADVVKELIAMFEAEMISNETALRQYGIKNPTRELDLVATQQKQSIRYQESRAKQFLYLAKAGVDPYNAAIISGYGEAAAKQIAKGINESTAGDLEVGQPATNDTKNITASDSLGADPTKDSSAVPNSGASTPKP